MVSVSSTPALARLSKVAVRSGCAVTSAFCVMLAEVVRLLNLTRSPRVIDGLRYEAFPASLPSVHDNWNGDVIRVSGTLGRLAGMYYISAALFVLELCE